MGGEQKVDLNWGKGKRRAAKFFLAAAGLLVGLTVCEVALRLVGYSFPNFYATDEFRGYALSAGVEGRYRKEGDAYVRINGDGLRDREHARAKPPNTLRIAVVGDSYPEALQVPQESAFWAVIERRLRECPALAGRDVEVINFGVSGYGTAQELITLRRHVRQYSPDLVLLAFTTNNDITDNSRVLKKTDEIPYFVYRDGALQLDDSFRASRGFRWRQSAVNRLGGWLTSSSRVLQALHEGHYALKGYIARRRAGGPASTRASQAAAVSAHQQQQQPTPAASRAAPDDAARALDDIGIDNLVYREPLDATWEEAWRVTEGLLVMMRDEVEAGGARFVVATLSNGIQVYPDSSARLAFLRRVGATDIFYPDLRVKALGEREGITVFNLAPELQAHAERNQIFLHGFEDNLGNGHWNVEGHAAAGELLAPKLCAELSR